jgi:hypothetical protein
MNDHGAGPGNAYSPFHTACRQENPMQQIKIRWGNLGTPIEAGEYHDGENSVRVTPGDIKLANGDPNVVFIAIRPNFFNADEPYLLTGVEFTSGQDVSGD